MSRLRHLILLAVAGALLIPAAPAAAGGCSAVTAQASGHNDRTIRSATLCLINRERTRRGLGKLRSNARLRRAAEKHAHDMVRRDFFSHDSPGGASLLDRLRKVRYVRPGSWAIGENIAWGSGSLGTPKAIVRAWMRSPGHRANILNRRFKEIGIGVAKGTPQGHSSGATYTTDFGRRG